MDLHWEIMDAKRADLLRELAVWRKDGFYLAGGTALALYLGHRTSQDFDFFTRINFSPSAPIERLAISPKKIRITTQTPGTSMAFIRGVQVSAFYYPYRLLRPARKAPFVDLASLEDIAAMKLLAVAQRGKRRDFMDLFFLCRKFALRDILRMAERKYPSFDPYSGLRGLLFFEEAEKEDRRVGVRLLKPASWGLVKRFFLSSAQRELRRLG